MHQKFLIILRTLFFFLILPFNILFADSNIDSLLSQLKKVQVQTEKIDLLNEISYFYFDIDIHQAFLYASEALELAQESNYLQGISDSRMRLGYVEQLKGAFEEAEKHYSVALQIRIKAGNTIPIANVYCSMGLNSLQQESFEKAELFYKKGLALLKKGKIEKTSGLLYNNLGELFSLQGNYTQALIYLDSSINVWKEVNDLIELANTKRKQGDLFLELGNKEKAELKFKESFSIFNAENNKKGIANTSNSLGRLYFESGQKDLAFNHFHQANELSSVLGEFDKAVILWNLGSIYKEQKKVKTALTHYQKSLEIFTRIDSDYFIPIINYNIGNLYKDQKKYIKARVFYYKCLPYLEKNPDQYTLAQVYHNLSEVYSILDSPQKALDYSQKYNNLRDEIYFDKIDAINYQRNQEEKQKEIAQLKAENLAKEKTNQRNNFLIALLIAGGLILIAMFSLYQNRQRRRLAEFQAKQAQLETNQAYLEIDELLQNQELVVANARLAEKEATQQQIGKDLHDSIGALLATVKLYFSDIFDRIDTLTEETTKKQQKTLDLLDEATVEVRRIAHNMQSGMLAKFGLAEAVKQLGNTLNDAGQLVVKVYTHGFKEQKASDTEFKLYKIIQELVSNTLKHAKAKQLTINLTKLEDNLNIIVEDNGIGFDPNSIGEKDGIGLKNITYRVMELGGTCHFDAVEGRGTNVIIDIPMQEAV